VTDLKLLDNCVQLLVLVEFIDIDCDDLQHSLLGYDYEKQPYKINPINSLNDTRSNRHLGLNYDLFSCFLLILSRVK